MARAGSKATKKSGKRRNPSRKEKRVEPGDAFNDPIVYAYSHRTRRSSPAFHEATQLPELVGFLLKAIQYFEIGKTGRPFPSRGALKMFFANQRLSDGSVVSAHLVGAMVTMCLPLHLMKGGRPRKGQPSVLDELHAGMSARERERVLLELVGGCAKKPPPGDEGENS